MKNKWLLSLPALLTTGAVQAAMIIGDGGSIGVASTGNGNFESKTGAVPGDNVSWEISEMPSWYNLSGAETQKSGTNQGVGGSPEGGYGAWLYTNFVLGNNTGYEVTAAGEQFDVSLYQYGFGGSAGYTGDETIRAYLFTTSSDTVDTGTSWSSDVTILGTADIPLVHLAAGTESRVLYTTSQDDVGKTAFLGLTLNNPTGSSPFPRIDVVQLSVTQGVVKSVTSLEISGPAELEEYTSADYICMAFFDDGSSNDVTTSADWSENSDFATISGGTLTAGGVDSDEAVTVSASYTYSGSTESTNLAVTILNTPDPEFPVVPELGWQTAVADYGLSGDRYADFDSDGQSDLFEFAHGGNPTNGSVQAPAPFMVYDNGTVTLYSQETTHTNSGVPMVAEWSENLQSNTWTSVWDSETSTPAEEGYALFERTVSGADKNNFFARIRLFPDTRRPNILLIMADDLGYADVSFNVDTPDDQYIYTPQMDALAAAGTRFTSAYVVHPFCGPSRMGLFTGRYPHEYGGPYNLPSYEKGIYLDQGMPITETTFSTVLQDAGYYTGMVGKWHLGEEGDDDHPNHRGFDDFWGYRGGGKNYFGPYQAQTGNVYDYKTFPEHNGVEVTDLTADDYMTDVKTDEGIRFLNHASTLDQPFFLFMSYNAPHTPLQAKQSDMDMYPQLSGSRQTYAGMVYGMDRGIGRLVEALKANGQYENTLIVFLSDNGGRTDQGALNTPLQGRKGDAWEGGFRVPMFMHWPGVIAEGQDYDHPFSALDFYPTFTRLAEAETPAGKELDGVDMWDDVVSQEKPDDRYIFVMRYNVGGGGARTDTGVRFGKWKATTEGANGWNWSLYDIENDIGETTDLSDTYPDILNDMVSAAHTWSTNEHVRPLWFDNTDAEATWDANNMPDYDATFAIP